jgi:hypothetical protein
MPKVVSPYRSLPVDRRVTLVTHVIKSSKEARELYVHRLASRPGGFRAVTLKTWPADKLAKEVVRQNAQTQQDEFDLLHLLYVELEPAIQTTFLDAAGVKHENGHIPDDLSAPYTDEAGVKRGAEAVRAQHGEDGDRYLQTLAKYNREAWPGIEQVAGAA